MAKKNANPSKATYRIGAVSRLTGIPAETLRVWERRYNVVEPGRAEGRFRLYTHDDVERLALVKQLVDTGNAIGSVAHLSIEQLQERLEAYGSPGLSTPFQFDQACRVAILGEALAARVAQQSEELRELEILGTYRDRQTFESEVREHRPDVIVLEYATVNKQTAIDVNQLLQSSRAKHAVVVYGFGRQETVHRLDTTKVTPLRAPVNIVELRWACLGITAISARPREKGFIVTGPVPQRRYDNDMLSKIAVASTTIACECPHHLSDLIMSLSAFEAYSAECESRSKEDATLHAHLQATTAQARSMLEDALARLVETERLQI
jgi:DNA-binding transcriptional MerR regulator